MESVIIGGSIISGIIPGGVSIGGSLRGSSFSGVSHTDAGVIAVTGAQAGGDLRFGTIDDDQIGGAPPGVNPISRIAGITIKGQALGTPAFGGDRFGFVAEHIVSLKIGGTAYPLIAGPNSPADFFTAGGSFDVNVRELL
jgi:hypothetical protein